MDITELIAELQKLRAEKGDLPVVFSTEFDRFFDVYWSHDRSGQTVAVIA